MKTKIKNPLISFIVCTYNKPVLIKRCIESILRQKYEGKKEILLVDGGSNKETLNVLRDYEKNWDIIKLIHNKGKLPEGEGKGKWLAWRIAKGEYIAIIDQDNELEGTNWIKEMLAPFSKADIFGCACRLSLRKDDSLTNQYVALEGTDPFMAYRSLDGIINLKKVRNYGKNRGLILKIDKDNLIITGGNCFVYKKDYLDNVGGYVQDTENIAKLVKSGKDKFAVPNFAYTHHLATYGFIDFLKKKKKWAKSRNLDNKEFSYFPKTKKQRKKTILNLFYAFFIFPNLAIGIKKYIETKQKAWLLHPIMVFLTALIYLIYSFFNA